MSNTYTDRHSVVRCTHCTQPLALCTCAPLTYGEAITQAIQERTGGTLPVSDQAHLCPHCDCLTPDRLPRCRHCNRSQP